MFYRAIKKDPNTGQNIPITEWKAGAEGYNSCCDFIETIFRSRGINASRIVGYNGFPHFMSVRFNMVYYVEHQMFISN